MSSAGGRPSRQKMVSVGTSTVPPGPRPSPADTPGPSTAATTPQVTASLHDFAVSLGPHRVLIIAIRAEPFQVGRYDGSLSHPTGRDSNSLPPGPNSLFKRGVIIRDGGALPPMPGHRRRPGAAGPLWLGSPARRASLRATRHRSARLTRGHAAPRCRPCRVPRPGRGSGQFHPATVSLTTLGSRASTTSCVRPTSRWPWNDVTIRFRCARSAAPV